MSITLFAGLTQNTGISSLSFSGITAVVSAVAGGAPSILMESSGYILLESGSNILLE